LAGSSLLGATLDVEFFALDLEFFALDVDCFAVFLWSVDEDVFASWVGSRNVGNGLFRDCR
jgi:hypothetical protein